MALNMLSHIAHSSATQHMIDVDGEGRWTRG
jgi:hypothetical protein